jgi:putative acetyltransferase
MNITIRHAEPSDFEAIRDIMAQPRAFAGTLQLPFPSADMWKKRIAEWQPGDHILVAEIDGKVVGNLGLHLCGKAARRKHVYTLGLSVHDDHQRNGVGTALLAAAIDLADNWLQVKRLELTVYTDNTAALALYGKSGFEIEGTHKAYAFRDGTYVDAHTMARIRM